MTSARALDASTFVVDSLDELRAVLATVPAARVLLRLLLDDETLHGDDDDDRDDDHDDGGGVSGGGRAFAAPLSTRVGLNLQVTCVNMFDAL